MRIAIQGCCHGQLDAIYKHIAMLEARNRYKVDLLLICGDFQAVRNHRDLQCMSVPNKYKELGGFYRYYSGQARAPVLTICIGGNHEASNYFHELYHGGWIAPNIYFLGHAGCVQVNGIRIAGISGIFKQHDFKLGQYETLPYGPDALRSIYHTREYNVRRLSLLSSPDIFLSHDWPLSIERHGDVQSLIRHKKHFKDEIQQGVFGSPPLMGLLTTLKPQWWFAAHMHTRFEATVVHQGPATARNPDELALFGDLNELQQPVATNPDEIVIDFEDDELKDKADSHSEQVAPLNPDEIQLSDEEHEVSFERAPVSQFSETKFLALDKCLPNRKFLEVIEYPAPVASETPRISLDPEWLAITKAFHPFFSTIKQQNVYPTEENARDLVRKASGWVQQHVMADGKVKFLEDVQRFSISAPVETDERPRIDYTNLRQPSWYPNPQTEAFCKLLDIKNNIM